MKNNGFLCCGNENGSRKTVIYVDPWFRQQKKALSLTHTHGITEQQKRIHWMNPCVFYSHFHKSHTQQYSRCTTTTTITACSLFVQCVFISIVALCCGYCTLETKTGTHMHTHSDTSSHTYWHQPIISKQPHSSVLVSKTIHSHIQTKTNPIHMMVLHNHFEWNTLTRRTHFHTVTE